MVNDSVADVLIRIKNGYMASRQEVSIPHSKLVYNICQLLAKTGYVEGIERVEKEIKITLKYSGRTPALTDVRRVSRPGLRVYKGIGQLPKVLNGLGIAIISTPKGLMTDKEARKNRVGGEVMAEVW